MVKAYEILSNDEQRKIYDQYGEEGLKEHGAGGFERSYNGGRKCKTRFLTMKIELEEVFRGGVKDFFYSKRVKCNSCEGTGSANPAARHECESCKGKGKKVVLQRMGPMLLQNIVECEVCNGTGSDIKDKCTVCSGTKVVFEKRKINVDIEKGIPDGYKYTFYGEGDEFPGAETGDLFIEIFLEKHKRFRREGADLWYKCDITLIEALTGLKRIITTLDGKKVLIEIENCISHGEIKTVKDYGLPFFNKPSEYGNLYIEFCVLFPTDITDKEALIQTEKILPDRLHNIPDLNKKIDKEVYQLSKFRIEDENTACSGGKTEKKKESKDFNTRGYI